MALKFTLSKPPSIETVSTSLTYIALTGLILAPLATARPSLPAAVEAHVTAAAPPNAPSRPALEAAMNSEKPVEQMPDATPAAIVVAAGDGPSTDARSIPAATPIREARQRLKSIRAREAKLPAEEAVRADAGPEFNEPAKSEPNRANRPEPAKPETRKEDLAKADTTAKTDAGDVPNPAAPPLTVWTDAEVTAALKECLRLLAPVAAEVEVNPAMRQGQCGTPAPILLKSIGTNPKLTFQPAVEINCPMAVALGEWAKDTLQPAARDSYGSEVSRIVSSSGYSCRNRYGLANERLSEHALANAIDIGGFALANGKTIKVTQGWGVTQRDVAASAKANEKAVREADATKGAADKASKTPTIKTDTAPTYATLKPSDAKDAKGKAKDVPLPANVAPVKISETDAGSSTDGKFLRRLHKGACETFGTVLGPEANEAHRDHFHFDLKARKRRAVCQ